MNKPLSGRVLLRALLPAVALAFFLVDAVRNPQRVFLSLGAALLGVSQAASYPLVAFCQMLAGLGGGAYMGTVFATVSDRVAPRSTTLS